MQLLARGTTCGELLLVALARVDMVQHGGRYGLRSHYGFHEGTPLPQDPEGLAEAMGGREKALARLDRFFRTTT